MGRCEHDREKRERGRHRHRRQPGDRQGCLSRAWPGGLHRYNQLPAGQTGRGADYIAIVPGEAFSDTLRPLLAYRQAQGLRVTAVPLEQIYAEFAHGRQTPAAVRDFLQYAHGNWQPPAPRFALLVGDASYEAPGVGGKQADLLPTHLAHTSFGGPVASDSE